MLTGPQVRRMLRGAVEQLSAMEDKSSRKKPEHSPLKTYALADLQKQRDITNEALLGVLATGLAGVRKQIDLDPTKASHETFDIVPFLKKQLKILTQTPISYRRHHADAFGVLLWCSTRAPFKLKPADTKPFEEKLAAVESELDRYEQ